MSDVNSFAARGFDWRLFAGEEVIEDRLKELVIRSGAKRPFVICSKSWAISTCPGSPQNGGSVPGWNNCWGVYNHISGDVKGDRFYGLFINNAFVNP